MDSSYIGSIWSTTSAWQNVHGNFRNRNNLMVLSHCVVEASFLVAWTDKNPRRKLRGCTNFKCDVQDAFSSGWYCDISKFTVILKILFMLILKSEYPF
uniref:Uncharacterized protein n=1 Tax=Lactuca sativa TaxID=4236 RepID=A0A9R1WBQ1_LACSA|nr:hypothetical protein LSAT_V11C200098820 [Lactuca sativa]